MVTAGPRYRVSKYSVGESVKWANVLCVADLMADCLAYGRMLKWNQVWC